MRKNRKLTDDEILDELRANGVNSTKAARDLGVNKVRVVRLAKQLRATEPSDGSAVAPKRTPLEASEGAVVRMAEVIERFNPAKDAEHAHRIAQLYTAAVQQYLLIANRPNVIQKTEGGGPTDFDLSRLSRAEMVELVRLHDKLNGIEAIEVSDLSRPVIYDDHSPDCTAPVPALEATVPSEV